MDSQPPLPAEDDLPRETLPPPPPSPPPSEQTSNQSNDRLDFGHGCGGTQSQVENSSPPAKRRKTAAGTGCKSGLSRKSAMSSLSENESLEDGELEESDWDIASRKSNTTPVMKSEDVVETSLASSVISSVASSGGDLPMSSLESSGREAITKHAKPTLASDAHNQDYEIIDDLGSEAEGSEDDDDDGNLGLDEDEEDFSVDEDEIDALLDGGMASYSKQKDESNSGLEEGMDDDPNPPVEKEKVVLRERGHDPFDILPEGWVVVTHNSGMPVYLHKQSRVCTLSRPYFLGPGSARKHDIPVSAIPCLSYQRALEKESQDPDSIQPPPSQENIPLQNGEMSEPGVDGEKPTVKIESAEEHKKENSLNPYELQEYCRKLFEFKTITVKRFKTWKDRRKHNLTLKKASRPSLPSSTKLITCPVPSENEAAKPNRKKEFVLNPTGKSDVCILHEYVQHAMRVQPRYIFKEIENGQTPYSATVVISEVQYGTGYATSKKAAKMEAARKTLEILIPEMNKMTDEDKKHDNQDLTFFDEIKIEDPRVSELFMKAGQPSPFQILYECLKRNYGVGDTQVVMDMKTLKHQKSEFSMKVGKHEAKVMCKNKREGKQQAAQAILQMMHPHIHTWGSLLRLYGRGSGIKEKKMEADLTHKLEGDLTQKVAVSIQWEGWMIVNTSVPYWELKRDTEQSCHLGRYIETMTVTPHKSVAGVTSAGPSAVSPHVVEPLTPEAGVAGPVTPEEDWVPVAGLSGGSQAGRMVHAAVQTEGRQEICLVVGSITHRATQTEWQGNSLFHKATQFPDMSYSSDDEDFKKPPPVAGPIIKLAEGYGTVTHVPRKQVVLVTKPDGEVTTVSLAPKSCEPEKYTVVEAEVDTAQEESPMDVSLSTPSLGPSPLGQPDKTSSPSLTGPSLAGPSLPDPSLPGPSATGQREEALGPGDSPEEVGDRIFDVRSPDSSTPTTTRPSSPLEGASNVYFASGAIRPMDVKPAGDAENSALYGSGGDSVRFVPRVVEQAKTSAATTKPEAPKTSGTTSPTTSPARTSAWPSPSENPAIMTPRQQSPRKSIYPTPSYQVSPQVAPFYRPQMYMANQQLAAYPNARQVAPSVGFPGTGLEQVGYGLNNPGMFYQPGLLQNPMAFTPQSQVQAYAQAGQAQAYNPQAFNQPVCYYDPSTGQLVYMPAM